MKTFLTITALAFALFCQGQQTFSFYSDGIKRQSAGVYDEHENLIRTLFTGQIFPSGTNSYSWDGKDDFGNTTAGGKYSVRLLTNNLKAEWEGVALNTSSQKSNTVWGESKKHNGYYGAAIDIYEHPTSGWVYYCTGYSENNITLRKFHINNPQEAVYLKRNVTNKYAEVQGPGLGGIGSIYNLCSDGRYLYCAAMTYHAQSAAHIDDNAIFILGFDIDPSSPTFDQMKTWSAGKSVNPGGSYSFPSAIVLGEHLDGTVNMTNLMSTGIAVSDNFLYLAQGKSNKISVFNKSTGAPLSSTTGIVNPCRMAADGNSLWIIYGNGIVGKFTVNADGVINSTPILKLSGLSDPHSLSIQDVGGVKYIYVSDGGGNQVVKRFRVADGSLDSGFNSGKGYFGQIGGYTHNSIVADDRFYFAKNQDKCAGISVKADGSFWLCDDGNNRVNKYNASFVKTHHLEWQGATYSLFMPQGDSSRLLVQLREYEVNYSGNILDSWTLKRQFQPSLPFAIQTDAAVWSSWLVKMSNGSTYLACATADKNLAIMELTDNGLRLAQTIIDGANGREAGKYNIMPDGSLIYSNYNNNGVTSFTRFALTGFTEIIWNGKAYQNPVWSNTGTVIGSAPFSAAEYTGLYAGVSNDNIVVFNPFAPGSSNDPFHRNYHIGLISKNGSSFKWRTAKAVNSPTGAIYPTNGQFEIGNGVKYPGSQAKAIDDFIHWQYHGEFWNGGQTNMHHLLYKNGLQLVQFGVAIRNSSATLPKGYPEMGGNTQTTAIIKIGDALYIWQGEEGYHCGVLRWKISGLNTIEEKIIPLYQANSLQANFNKDQTSGCAPLAVGFTDASTAGTDKITGWLWSFGDGSTATEQNPSHTYAKAGNYTVSLKVTTAAGVTNTYTSTDLVRVVSNPTATIVSDPSACVQAPVSFTGKTDVSSSSDLSWAWDFGNGQKSTAASPDPQVYTAPGNYTVSLNVKDASGCSASTKTTVSVQSAPVLAVGPGVTINAGDVAQLSASGAERYTWNNGATLSCTDCATPKASPTATTTYTVTGLNSAGCSTTATVTVTVNTTEPSTSPGTPPPPPPPPPASPAQAGYNANQSSGCAPLAVGFTDASTAGTDKITGWLWSFGDGSIATEQNPSHTYTKAGNYTVSLKVTTAAGVTNTYTGTTAIQVNGVPAVRIVGDSVGCVQAKARFQGQTDLAAGTALSWSWDFGNGQKSTAANPDPQVYAASGNYPVTAIVKTEDGCVAKAVATYSVKSAPLLSVNPAVQVCAGSAAQLSASGAERYTWNNGATLSCADCATPKASPTATTTYTVTGVSSAGCSTTATVTVRVQERQMLTLAKADAICTGETVNLKASGTDLYQWVASADIKTQTAGETIAKPQASTVYTVIGKDALGCFADTASIAVTVHALPKISAGPDVEVCKGSAKQLTATGGTRYQWQADATLSCSACASPLVAPASNANYIVTGTDAYGCSARDTVAVTVHQPFQLNVDQPTDICIGGTARLSATGADQYSWSPASSVAQPTAGVTTATPPASMRYTVTAKDNHNCFTDTASVVVTVWPIPTVEAGDVKELSVGNSLELKPTYSSDVTRYKWTPAETLNCSTCPSPYANPTTETTYTVEVSNNGGCKASASVTVHVICNGGNLFIPNTFSPNGDGRNDRFYVKGVGVNKVKSLKVYNRWGDLVFARENMPANNENVGWDGTYKGQQLPSDVYIYSCEVVCQNNELLTYKGDVTLLR